MSFTLANAIEIAPVGFGSYKATEGNGKDTIKMALDCGYRYIDTAALYKNEKEIGEALNEYGLDRKEIFLCSKVWPTMLGEKETLESFEKSCEDLQTDFLDMYLIHWPKANQTDDKWQEKLAAGWAVMEKLYEEGKIKAIGLSNFLPHHVEILKKTAKVKPMLDQLELHVGYMQEYTLEYLKKENILPQAWSPLGRGKVLGDSRVNAFAEKYGKSSAQVLLRFLLQRGIPVIPKASSTERMKANLDVFDFTISEEDMSILSCFEQVGWSGEHPDTVDFGF